MNQEEERWWRDIRIKALEMDCDIEPMVNGPILIPVEDITTEKEEQ
jgi:hypothetical protein